MTADKILGRSCYRRRSGGGREGRGGGGHDYGGSPKKWEWRKGCERGDGRERIEHKPHHRPRQIVGHRRRRCACYVAGLQLCWEDVNGGRAG